MKTWLFRLCLVPLFLSSSFLQAVDDQELIIHNRILATINGKNISVIDVMKKMDVFLVKNAPEYSKSDAHRYQFFSQHWRDSLQQLIDNELILADATNLEIKIGDSEIRQKIHEQFGPNVMASLDKLGMTMDEAWQMVYTEMAVGRMSWYRVHSKATHRVCPQDIKTGYNVYLTANPPKESWKYQVLSIRSATDSLGNLFAQKAQALIHNDPIPFEVLAAQLKEEIDDAGVTVSVSEELEVEGSKLSNEHKNILCSLEPGSYSEPITQISRREGTPVHRIFYLKEHVVTPPNSFDSMVEVIHEQLLSKQVEKEYPVYLRKLHKKFNFDETELDSLLRDFVPFELR